MLEALIAGIILITFLVTLKATYLSATPEEDASITAYTTLKQLDDSGLLRSGAAAYDYDSINSEIKLYFYNHTIEICNAQGTCYGRKPSSDNVWIGSYFISGDDSYSPRTVNLYLWRDI